jgi:hypothetical protein
MDGDPLGHCWVLGGQIVDDGDLQAEHMAGQLSKQGSATQCMGSHRLASHGGRPAAAAAASCCSHKQLGLCCSFSKDQTMLLGSLRREQQHIQGPWQLALPPWLFGQTQLPEHAGKQALPNTREAAAYR